MRGSDHESFEGAGVPGFAVQQDMADYRFTHHSQSDTFDKAKEPDLIQGTQVMALAAMRVASSWAFASSSADSGSDMMNSCRSKFPPALKATPN